MAIETADTARVRFRGPDGKPIDQSVSEYVKVRARSQETDKKIKAEVHVNHGRWVSYCPFCNSAQLASKTDRRFFCIECLNAAVGGRWLATEWPPEAKDIEVELLKRPKAENQNWNAAETMADLQAEHRAAMDAMLKQMDDETLQYVQGRAALHAKNRKGG